MPPAFATLRLIPIGAEGNRRRCARRDDCLAACEARRLAHFVRFAPRSLPAAGRRRPPFHAVPEALPLELGFDGELGAVVHAGELRDRAAGLECLGELLALGL